MALLAPSSLIADRFVVVAPLADRGLGEAYHCRDPKRADGSVLVKLLRPVGPALPPALDDLLTRTQRARHDGILRVYDHGLWGGRPFVAYEFFEGSSLGTGLDQARAEGTVLPVELLREVFEGVVAALDAAHTRAPRSVLHLGLDPSSVILRRLPGKPLKLKVLDFGLASWADLPADVPPESARRLRCAPPEAYGGDASPQSDVFSLGALLRELLAPAAAPDATTPGRQLRDDVPEELLVELARAAAPAKERRHASVAVFAQAVRDAWARPLRPKPSAPNPTPEPSEESDRPTLTPSARPAPQPEPRALPVEGPLPPLPPAEARAAVVRERLAAMHDIGDTVLLANVAARRPPSPWDIGALRDEQAEREEQAAAEWFRPRAPATDDTVLVLPRAKREDAPGVSPADDGVTMVALPTPDRPPPPTTPATPPAPAAVSDTEATIVVTNPPSQRPRTAPPAVVTKQPPAQHASPAVQPNVPTRRRPWVAVAVGVVLVLVGVLLALRS
mgnify:CR=1 FL=1